jgi:hypothetical protein
MMLATAFANVPVHQLIAHVMQNFTVVNIASAMCIAMCTELAIRVASAPFLLISLVLLFLLNAMLVAR